MTKKLKSGTPFVYDENDRVVGIRDPHTGTDTDLVTAVTSPGGGIVRIIVTLSQAEYDAIPIKDATTLYIRWASSTTAYPIYARSQSAPVDYGSFDPEGFALLAGGNAFTGRQDLLTDLPTLTVEDLNGDAEWTVLSSVKDDLGQMRSAMLGAKVDLSPFNLGIQRAIGVATFEADRQTGLNTGRILVQIAATRATDENGTDLGMRILNGVLPDMRVIHMLSNDGTSALLTVGTPQRPSDAANKGYVDDAVAGVEAGTGVDAGVVNEIGRASCRERVSSPV